MTKASDNLVERLRAPDCWNAMFHSNGSLSVQDEAAPFEAATHIETLAAALLEAGEALDDAVAIIAAVRASAVSEETWTGSSAHFHKVCGEMLVRIRPAVELVKRNAKVIAAQALGATDEGEEG